MTAVRKPGFDFSFDPEACRTCGGACCRGEPGNIWVAPGELAPLADYLGIPVPDLILERLVRAGGRYSVRERIRNGEHCCLFLDPDGGGCAVYPVRPSQCRTYPFWDRYRDRPDLAREECPGILP